MDNTNYKTVKENMLKQPKIWCITGVSGFIGSNLLEALLNLDQKVIGLDNFSFFVAFKTWSGTYNFLFIFQFYAFHRGFK